MYQEWTNYIYAARDKLEQNLELSRSPTNNMLYYHAIKPIKMGEPLLAWYSQKVEEELCKNLLNRESLCDAPLSYKGKSIEKTLIKGVKAIQLTELYFQLFFRYEM